MRAANDNTNYTTTACESGKLSARKLNLILRGVAKFDYETCTISVEVRR